MLIFVVALARCIALQRTVDFGAAFATWIAAAASHGSDFYWAATCAAVLVVELVFPPSLALVGTTTVVAHTIVTSSFEAKQIGAIVIALLSLSQAPNRAWLPFFQSKKNN